MEKELKNIEIKLKEINSIITKLDPEIKLAAFELLRPYILGNLAAHSAVTTTQGLSKVDTLEKTPVNSGDVRDFYASFNPKKPADSALVLAGWIYTQQGSSAFELGELRGLFDEVGVSSPARLDMTLKNCLRGGKKLFQNAGHGDYRPTVYGENHFKAEMNLRPSKKVT